MTIRYCPLCGSKDIHKVARRQDNKESVYTCWNCKDAFSAILMGKNVIKELKDYKPIKN